MDRRYISSTSTESMLVSVAGPEVAAKIMQAMGGDCVYIPRGGKAERDEAIKYEFRDLLARGGTSMSSYRQLAREHGLSTRRIMAIVNH